MGTKLRVWKQGQFYPGLGKMVVELPRNAKMGPSDSQVRIEGFGIIPDSEGNFLKGDYTTDEFDAIHTYGIVRMVIDMYELILEKDIRWSWWQNGINEPLRIQIRNSGINSRYLREHQCIELDYYGPYGKRIYNCRTVDLVAHEIGHAILDSLKPQWANGDVQTQGIVESLCDLTACFWILNQQELCREVISETKGDLKQDSILSLFGVGHGHSKNPNREIRNALKPPEMSKASHNHYVYGEQLSYLLFQALINKFQAHDSPANELQTTLQITGRHWMETILETVQDCDSNNTSIAEFIEIFTTKYPS